MKKTYKCIALMLVTAVFSGLFSFGQPAIAAGGDDVYIRANQVGYKPTWSKEAFALSKTDLAGQSFTLKDSGGTAVFTGTVGKDRGSWGDLGEQFSHVYSLDFSSFQTPGNNYTITVAGKASLPFSISDDPYAGLAPLSLEFFKTQRCGDTNPSGHDSCHQTDGMAADGPMAGSVLEATGGWHDAADYIKFMVTTSYSTDIMLASYLYHPDKFPDPGNGVLAEAKIGLDFMEKMWDNEHQILYMSVADADEHGRWDTWPEDDNYYEGPRPVYSCPEGTGANIAGKAAAAFALASEIWGDPDMPYYNEELAAGYLETAVQLYDFGKTHQAVAADRDGGYEESEWKDDMALGAAELYRATGTTSYLAEAKAYADTLGVHADGEWPEENLSWSREYHWANYEIAKLDATYAATAAARMGRHLNAAWWNADGNPWYMGLSDMRWSSNAMISQLAVEACMYKELSGLSTYMPLAQREFNYLLGSNPWGASFLNSAGSNWWVNPRHRVDYLNKQKDPGWNLVGAWCEGATSKAIYDANQNDRLDESQPDQYAAFQDRRAVWHDNRMDFVTNEACINANAAGLAVSVWFDAATDIEPDENIPEPEPPITPPPTQEEENTKTYIAVEDSFVRAGSDEEDYYDKNYGDLSVIEIKGNPPEDGYMRQGYFKFDVDVPEDAVVIGAKLRLYGSGDSTATTKVFSVEDESWTEKGITYSNCPALSAEPLDAVEVTSAAKYYEYNVTGFVQSEVSLGQKLISFAVTGRDEDEDVKVTFNSRESGENQPQLVIITEPEGPAPTLTPTPTPVPTSTPTPGPASNAGSTPKPAAAGNTVTVSAILSDNGVAAVVNAVDLKAAIDNTKDGIVNIVVQAAEGAKSIRVDVPAREIGSMGQSKTLKINAGLAEVSFPSDFLKGILSATSSNIQFSVSKADISALSEEARNVIGNNTVYDFSLSVDGNTVGNLGSGEKAVTVELNYKLQPGEDPNNVVVYYINDSGKLMVVKNGVYNPDTGRVKFSPSHFSKYAAAYAKATLKDIGNVLWAKSSIEALAARGTVSGTGAGDFDPNRKVTRAEFVKMLMEAFGLVDEAAECKFSDVRSGEWYYSAVASAWKLGIVTDKGDGSLGVNDSITREDMAVMAYKTWILVESGIQEKGTPSFADASEISPYALEAVAALQKAGILNGVGDGRFGPQEMANRAQAAVIVYRLFGSHYR